MLYVDETVWADVAWPEEIIAELVNLEVNSEETKKFLIDLLQKMIDTGDARLNHRENTVGSMRNAIKKFSK